MKKKELSNDEKASLRQTLVDLREILSRFHLGQSEVVDGVLNLLSENKDEELIKILNGVDFWGGSGAVWEVYIPERESNILFQEKLIELINKMKQFHISYALNGRRRCIKREIKHCKYNWDWFAPDFSPPSLKLVLTECGKGQGPFDCTVVENERINGRQALLVKIEPIMNAFDYGRGLHEIKYLFLLGKYGDRRIKHLDKFPIDVVVVLPEDFEQPTNRLKRWSEMYCIAWGRLEMI